MSVIYLKPLSVRSFAPVCIHWIPGNFFFSMRWNGYKRSVETLNCTSYKLLRMLLNCMQLFNIPGIEHFDNAPRKFIPQPNQIVIVFVYFFFVDSIWVNSAHFLILTLYIHICAMEWRVLFIFLNKTVLCIKLSVPFILFCLHFEKTTAKRDLKKRWFGWNATTTTTTTIYTKWEEKESTHKTRKITR